MQEDYNENLLSYCRQELCLSGPEAHTQYVSIFFAARWLTHPLPVCGGLPAWALVPVTVTVFLDVGPRALVPVMVTVFLDVGPRALVPDCVSGCRPKGTGASDGYSVGHSGPRLSIRIIHNIIM